MTTDRMATLAGRGSGEADGADAADSAPNPSQSVTTMAWCAGCGGTLRRRRANQTHCGGACRQAALRRRRAAKPDADVTDADVQWAGRPPAKAGSAALRELLSAALAHLHALEQEVRALRYNARARRLIDQQSQNEDEAQGKRELRERD